MSVIVGSARINEKGGINDGAAGDQTGGEVSTQAWYLHNKGWVVIRAKDPVVREKIAKNMQAICDNDNIGYCQDHRTSLTNAAKPYGYNASKVKTKVEVDCSEAVRNCVLYAGINVGSFSTSGEVSALKNTGKFEVMTDDMYCKAPDYLLRGDILVTRTKGHTVVVLSNGSKVSTIGNGAGSGASGTAVSSNLAVGTIITFTGNKHYTSANAASGKDCKPGKAKVTAISAGAKHPYHLVHMDPTSNVYGWVDAADVGTKAAGGVPAAPAASSLENALVCYTVKKGDTLYSIAKKCGTTVDKLVEANKKSYPQITAKYIVVGWKLAIRQ